MKTDVIAMLKMAIFILLPRTTFLLPFALLFAAKTQHTLISDITSGQRRLLFLNLRSFNY